MNAENSIITQPVCILPGNCGPMMSEQLNIIIYEESCFFINQAKELKNVRKK